MLLLVYKIYHVEMLFSCGISQVDKVKCPVLFLWTAIVMHTTLLLSLLMVKQRIFTNNITQLTAPLVTFSTLFVFTTFASQLLSFLSFIHFTYNIWQVFTYRPISIDRDL